MGRLTRAQAADLVARFERAVLRRASTKGEHGFGEKMLWIVTRGMNK